MRKRNSKAEKNEDSLGDKLDRILDDNSLTFFRLGEL
jgi:hypothetical protein